MRKGSKFSLFAFEGLIVLVPFFEKTTISLLSYVGSFVKNQLIIYVFSLWILLFHCLLPVLQSFDYCNFIVLKSGGISPLTLFFFFKIVLAIPGIYISFHINFRIRCWFLQKGLLGF